MTDTEKINHKKSSKLEQDIKEMCNLLECDYNNSEDHEAIEFLVKEIAKTLPDE